MARKSEVTPVVANELYKKNLELLHANQQLALLQKLYEIMAHTFKMEPLCQQFIDVIIKDLDYLGGTVALRNPLNSHLQVVAVTKAKWNKDIEELVGGAVTYAGRVVACERKCGG